MIIKTKELNISSIDEGYEHLAISIVIQAISDYREILQNGRIKKLSITKYNIKEIEQFFDSEWYTLLTKFNGNKLKEIIKEQIKNNDATN